MRNVSRLGSAAVAVLLIALAAASATRGDSLDRTQPVPLGGALGAQHDDRRFGVFVPTRFGGELTISTTAGVVSTIIGPDGRVRFNGQDVGNDAQGWYTFSINGADESYTVSTTFVQVGKSHRKPWNFYYWPTKSDAIHEPWSGGNGRVDTIRVYGDDKLVATPGAPIKPGQDIVRAGRNGVLETPVAAGDDLTWFPNLYDDLTFQGADGKTYATPSPLLKYDQLFNSSARAWEAANSQNQDISRWPGHCLGGAVASILLNEPTPMPGSGVSRDELKSLWAELGENHLNHRISDYVTDIPPGPPRPGFDDCDPHAPRFHAMLETHIRGRRESLLGNLRAFPPRGTNTEVWNHGIGEFTARYSAIPGKGERAVKLEVDLVANAGASLNGKDQKPRIIHYVYNLVYGLDGKIDETQTDNADWISLSGEALFAPLNLMEVVQTRWAGHNPYVTEANVRALDLANGGGSAYKRFAGTPPEFRPIVTNELGQAPRIISDTNLGSGDDEDALSPPRRASLFSFLRRR